MTFPTGGYTSVSNARTDGVILYWPIEESSGEVITDYGPYGRHFDVLNDASNTSLVTGKFGNARALAVQNGSIKLESTPLTGHIAHTSSHSQITLSFWVNADLSAMSTNYSILRFSTDGAGNSLYISITGTKATDRLYFDVGSASTYITGSTYLTGVWRHVVMTLDRTDADGGTLNVYIDDSQVITNFSYWTYSEAQSYFRPEFGRNLLLTYSAAPSTVDLIGAIDDICVWNRILAGSEITELYNSGTGTEVVTTLAASDVVGDFPSAGYTDMNDAEVGGLVSYYPFNEASGTTFACYGLINKSGSVSNDPTDTSIVTGKFSNARDGVANGSSTTVLILAPELSGFTDECYGLTVSFWTNFDSSVNTADATLFQLSSLQYSTKDLDVTFMASSGALRLTAGTFFDTSDLSATFDGSWHHVFIKVREESDGTQDAQVWVDNSQVTSDWTNIGTSKLFKPWYRTHSFGCSNSFQTTNHLDGAIDDFGIWMRPLTNEDKTRLYNSGTGVALAQSTAYVRTAYETPAESMSFTESINQSLIQAILVSELATVLDYPYELGTTVAETLTESASWTDAYSYVVVGMVDETIQEIFSIGELVDSSVVLKLAETIYFEGSVTPGQIINLALNDTVGMTEALVFIYEALIQDSLATTDAATLAYVLGELLNEYVVLSEAHTVQQVLVALAATALAVADNSVLSFPEALAEALVHSDTLEDKIEGYMTLIDQVATTETVTPFLSALVVVDESITAIDTLTAPGVLNNLLSDALSFTLTFFDGEEAYVGWVMNAANYGVTQYSNYAFNSFAKVGGTYLAANSAGLFKLEGDDDAGVSIDALVKTGRVDVGNGSQTRIEKAYLGCKSDGKMLLKTITGDNIERWYTSTNPRSGSDTLKFTLGKGVKTRYWQFELANIDGQDFDIGDIELLPVVLTRR